MDTKWPRGDRRSGTCQEGLLPVQGHHHAAGLRQVRDGLGVLDGFTAGLRVAARHKSSMGKLQQHPASKAVC